MKLVRSLFNKQSKNNEVDENLKMHLNNVLDSYFPTKKIIDNYGKEYEIFRSPTQSNWIYFNNRKQFMQRLRVNGKYYSICHQNSPINERKLTIALEYIYKYYINKCDEMECMYEIHTLHNKKFKLVISGKNTSLSI